MNNPNDIANIGENKAVPFLGFFLKNDWEKKWIGKHEKDFINRVNCK